MQPLITDPSSALLRAVRARFSGPSLSFAIEELRSRSWASVTFSGARHQLSFRLDGERAEAAAAAFLASLPTAEFKLRGHMLADLALVSEERRPGQVRITLEALTVEDR